ITLNPAERANLLTDGTQDFIHFVSNMLHTTDICQALVPTDVVGNIRFTHPTLYVFPGGDGDSALFGVNGFNMLIDGGYERRACSWDLTRHLDRLDAVVMTRLNASTTAGLASLIHRKVVQPVHPHIGYMFANLLEPSTSRSPDGNKHFDPLLVHLLDEGHRILSDARKLELEPQAVFREDGMEPINLYHKVGHGSLDMYVLNPARDSPEVKEFLRLWKAGDAIGLGCRSFSVKLGQREVQIPVTSLVSLCVLLVWQPSDPKEKITRILLPGSTPQQKIFEAFAKLRHLSCLKYPTCTAKSLHEIIGETEKEHKKKTKVETVEAVKQKIASSVSSPRIKSKTEKSEKKVIKSLDELDNKDLEKMLIGEVAEVVNEQISNIQRSEVHTPSPIKAKISSGSSERSGRSAKKETYTRASSVYKRTKDEANKRAIDSSKLDSQDAESTVTESSARSVAASSKRMASVRRTERSTARSEKIVHKTVEKVPKPIKKSEKKIGEKETKQDKTVEDVPRESTGEAEKPVDLGDSAEKLAHKVEMGKESVERLADVNQVVEKEKTSQALILKETKMEDRSRIEQDESTVVLEIKEETKIDKTPKADEKLQEDSKSKVGEEPKINQKQKVNGKPTVVEKAKFEEKSKVEKTKSKPVKLVSKSKQKTIEKTDQKPTEKTDLRPKPITKPDIKPVGGSSIEASAAKPKPIVKPKAKEASRDSTPVTKPKEEPKQKATPKAATKTTETRTETKTIVRKIKQKPEEKKKPEQKKQQTTPSKQKGKELAQSDEEELPKSKGIRGRSGVRPGAAALFPATVAATDGATAQIPATVAATDGAAVVTEEKREAFVEDQEQIPIKPLIEELTEKKEIISEFLPDKSSEAIKQVKEEIESATEVVESATPEKVDENVKSIEEEKMKVASDVSGAQVVEQDAVKTVEMVKIKEISEDLKSLAKDKEFDRKPEIC
ncbi:hypothetical protein QYM36_009594, partial [Artemia franciscana]